MVKLLLKTTVNATQSQKIKSFPDPIVHKLALSPVIDGDFLPGEPESLFGNAADIDYIAGVNDMDGHIFATLDVPSINNALASTPV